MLTSSGVAVVADSWWRRARRATRSTIEWDAGPNAALNDAKIAATLRKGAAGAGRVARNDGDAAAAIKGAARVVRADYELPLLAHATLEPQNCTADVRADGADIYVPTQVQQIAQATAAKAAGLDPKQVNVHTTFLGGGFGRRLEVDFIPAAVEASKAVKKPVKLIWTREDDMTHDAYRPPAFDQADGRVRRQGQAHRVEPASDRAVDHRAHVPVGHREDGGSVRRRGAPLTIRTTCPTCTSISSSRRSASTWATGAR